MIIARIRKQCFRKIHVLTPQNILNTFEKLGVSENKLGLVPTTDETGEKPYYIMLSDDDIFTKNEISQNGFFPLSLAISTMQNVFTEFHNNM